MDMVAHHAKAQEVDKKELREFVQQKDKMVLSVSVNGKPGRADLEMTW
jgi:hypothetical protein